VAKPDEAALPLSVAPEIYLGKSLPLNVSSAPLYRFKSNRGAFDVPSACIPY